MIELSPLTSDVTSLDVEAIKTVLIALNEVVEKAGPDFIYQKRTDYPAYELGGNCRYLWEGKPDCIAAKVMVKLGFPISKLKLIEGRGCFVAFQSEDIRDLNLGQMVLPKVFDSLKAGWVLRAAQTQQDQGRAWGIALAVAINRAHSYGVDFDPRQPNVTEETT